MKMSPRFVARCGLLLAIVVNGTMVVFNALNGSAILSAFSGFFFGICTAMLIADGYIFAALKRAQLAEEAIEYIGQQKADEIGAFIAEKLSTAFDADVRFERDRPTTRH